MGALAAKIDFHEAGRPFEEKGQRRLAQALRRTTLRAVRERERERESEREPRPVSRCETPPNIYNLQESEAFYGKL